ncbi:UNVERIFIED_CONTAM: Wall-associated receptor kinase-like 14 [Sesamum calycinum]|uniref:Wall-associated receptor kinase-like 14 n=1 Tax=Sesamum calycinum TaxID=2727403 RepID=A0AAW2SVL0_9LAMI
MILLFRQLIVPSLLSVLALSSLAQNFSSVECDQSCGTTHVSYPFGFSDGCKIKLNCTSRDSGAIMINDFRVENVTSDQILISVPPKCNRRIEELSGLFGTNFAPTWRNGILLENCSARVNDCVIPSRLVRSRIGFDCDSGEGTDYYNVSCYSVGLDDVSEFLDFGKVTAKGNCSALFSSIMVDSNDGGNSFSGSSPISLDFQTAELGWWVDGGCDCDPNASCTRVTHGGQMGYRCKCKKGYAGDGFAEGKRCRKVSDCSAGGFMSGRCRGSTLGILIGEGLAYGGFSLIRGIYLIYSYGIPHGIMIRKFMIIERIINCIAFVGIIAGVLLVVILAVIWYCVKRRGATFKSRLSAKRLISEAAGSSNVPFYPYKEIERATNGFSEKQRLGTGAYGTVYAGKLHNDEWVAIKKIRYRDHDSVEQVMNEIKLLSSVSHPNLVRLLGCCIENGEQILVYEYMPNGTLSHHLQREGGSVLPWTIRLTIAAETAHAIAHLHSAMNPPIYHRDIKSSNILLDYNFHSKVADFGLSRFGMTDDSHVSTAPQGTPGYVDPQYHQNFHLSDKSDVYSFGVVLVEIITAKKVVDFSRPHSEINLAALAIDRIGKGRVDEIIDPFLEPNRDAWTLSSVHKVAELAFRCLAFHRDMRPSMMEVADELEQIRLSGWAPLDENIHMGSSVASSCSSPYQGSEKSLNTSTTRKANAGSRRLIVPRGGDWRAYNRREEG